jgi:hypothetical protein
MTRVLHLRFSPDLATSDFYLLWERKTGLHGALCDNEDVVIDGVTAVLMAVIREEREAIFSEWLVRLAACM